MSLSKPASMHDLTEEEIKIAKAQPFPGIEFFGPPSFFYFQSYTQKFLRLAANNKGNGAPYELTTYVDNEHKIGKITVFPVRALATKNVKKDGTFKKVYGDLFIDMDSNEFVWLVGTGGMGSNHHGVNGFHPERKIFGEGKFSLAGRVIQEDPVGARARTLADKKPDEEQFLAELRAIDANDTAKLKECVSKFKRDFDNEMFRERLRAIADDATEEIKKCMLSRCDMDSVNVECPVACTAAGRKLPSGALFSKDGTNLWDKSSVLLMFLFRLSHYGEYDPYKLDERGMTPAYALLLSVAKSYGDKAIVLEFNEHGNGLWARGFDVNLVHEDPAKYDVEAFMRLLREAKNNVRSMVDEFFRLYEAQSWKEAVNFMSDVKMDRFGFVMTLVVRFLKGCYVIATGFVDEILAQLVEYRAMSEEEAKGCILYIPYASKFEWHDYKWPSFLKMLNCVSKSNVKDTEDCESKSPKRRSPTADDEDDDDTRRRRVDEPSPKGDYCPTSPSFYFDEDPRTGSNA